MSNGKRQGLGLDAAEQLDLDAIAARRVGQRLDLDDVACVGGQGGQRGPGRRAEAGAAEHGRPLLHAHLAGERRGVDRLHRDACVLRRLAGEREPGDLPGKQASGRIERRRHRFDRRAAAGERAHQHQHFLAHADRAADDAPAGPRAVQRGRAQGDADVGRHRDGGAAGDRQRDAPRIAGDRRRERRRLLRPGARRLVAAEAAVDLGEQVAAPSPWRRCRCRQECRHRCRRRTSAAGRRARSRCPSSTSSGARPVRASPGPKATPPRRPRCRCLPGSTSRSSRRATRAASSRPPRASCRRAGSRRRSAPRSSPSCRRRAAAARRRRSGRTRRRRSWRSASSCRWPGCRRSCRESRPRPAG